MLLKPEAPAPKAKPKPVPPASLPPRTVAPAIIKPAFRPSSTNWQRLANTAIALGALGWGIAIGMTVEREDGRRDIGVRR